MRRLLLVLAVLALVSLTGDAKAEQGSWQPRLSLYSGQFSSIAFMSRDVVLARGLGGVLRSDDGGQRWSWAVNGSVADLELVGDGLHAWAVGDAGRIVATANGGRTWSPQQSGTDLTLFDIAAFGSRSAIVLGQRFSNSSIPTNTIPPYVILRTDDGGQSWQTVPFPSNYLPSKLMAVPGGNRAWLAAQYCGPKKDPGAIGNCGWVPATFRSDDRGQSWTRVEQAPEPWSPTFVSADVGWALDGYALKRTEDGGRTWHAVREWPQGGPYPRNLSVLDEDTALLEERGNGSSQIIKTHDAGKTWDAVGGPQKDVLALAYLDEERAVRSGADHPLTWSGDGGLTWNPTQTPVFVGSSAFDFVGSTGWLSASKLLRTSDGGLTWQPVSDIRPFALDFVSPVEGWALESRCDGYPCTNAILHSADGGVTWEEQKTYPSGGVSGLTFVDSLNGWVVADSLPQYKLLHTRDGGKTWQEQSPPGEVIDFVDAAVVWAAGSAPGEGDIYHPFVSLDGGDTWSRAGSLAARGMPTLTAFDATHAWWISETYEPGWDGSQLPPFTLYRTTNGGATWEQLGDRSRERYMEMEFFSPSDGIAVRQICPESGSGNCRDELARTFDGGITWNNEDIDFGPMALGYGNRYVFSDLWHGWAVLTTGAYEMSSATLHSYSAATPSIEMPDTGEGRRDGTPVAPLAALGALGVVLVGVGGIVGLRRRRRDG